MAVELAAELVDVLVEDDEEFFDVLALDELEVVVAPDDAPEFVPG